VAAAAPVIDALVVTGAGRGIGRSIALNMAQQHVPILCISKTRADKTAEEIRASGGQSDSLVLDLADYATAEKAVRAWATRQSHTRYGVVLAAGVVGPQGSLLDTPLDKWDEALSVNLLGNLAVIKGLLPSMLSHAFGRILMFSGGGSAYAYPLFPAYSASKTAVVRACENLHEDLRSRGDFAVTCLAPGAVDTDILAQVRAAGGDVRTVTDIAEPTAFAAAFLTSKRCAFSGCFVHVRDNWRPFLDTDQTLQSDSLWKLRRVE